MLPTIIKKYYLTIGIEMSDEETERSALNLKDFYYTFAKRIFEISQYEKESNHKN